MINSIFLKKPYVNNTALHLCRGVHANIKPAFIRFRQTLKLNIEGNPVQTSVRPHRWCGVVVFSLFAAAHFDIFISISQYEYFFTFLPNKS